MRIKTVRQLDETDCGAACIATVLKYYGRSVPIRKIRKEAGTDKIGTSGFGIIKAAQKYGLSCKGFSSPDKSKIVKIPECKDCWARYICGGECFAVSYIQNKSLNKPVSVMCRLKKHLAKLSIYFWLCMKYEYPDVYVKMQKKYGGVK